MKADWTPAPASPPLNNVEAPINVGASPTSIQYGQGALQFDFLSARDTVQSNVEIRSPKYCDENGENCFDSATITNIFNYISVSGDKWLVNHQHTEEGCTALGGMVVDDGNNNKFCRYTASSCPSNWTQYNSFISYNSNSCSVRNCDGSTTGCTVPGVAWGSRPGDVPYCSYSVNTHSSGQSCDNVSSRRCVASVASIGCY